MIHPGYLLNPGDLFQVNPERVLFATGAPKDKMERRQGRLRRRPAPEKEEGEEGAEKSEEAESAEGKSESSESAAKKEEDPRESLKILLAQAKTIMSTNKDTIPAKRKQEIRGFQRAIRRVLSRSSSTVLADSLDAQFAELKAVLSRDSKEILSRSSKSASGDKPATEISLEETKATATEPTSDPNSESTAHLSKILQQAAESPDQKLDESAVAELSDFDLDVVKQALVQLQDNPIDSSKPYATPWRPRDYMSAFAFIPRYLEVNQNICAAVYLRHPVARPGVAEVPTPFNEVVGGNAFTWYLRSR